jgi:hypothetical protein
MSCCPALIRRIAPRLAIIRQRYPRRGAERFFEGR